MNRSGFTIFLTFLITTVVFMLVTSSMSIAKSSVDVGHSDALATQAFHAADGGIERGLGRLETSFAPFNFSYSCDVSKNRRILVEVAASRQNDKMSLSVKATVLEGSRELAFCSLSRPEIKDLPGRAGIGRLVEAL